MTTRPECWLATALMVAGALGFTASSASADGEPARALYEQGLEATEAGRHLEAGDAFLAAYELDRNPSLLWNAARSLDAGGDTDGARALYSHYVSVEGVPEPNVDTAREWLRAHPAAIAVVDDAPPRVRVIVRRHGARGSPVAGWTLTGLGLAAAVGASITMVFAAQSRDATYGLVWDQGYQDTLSAHQRLSDEAELRELAAWMTYGAAAALLASGLVCLFSGGETDGPGAPTLSLGPMPGGMRAGASWRF